MKKHTRICLATLLSLTPLAAVHCSGGSSSNHNNSNRGNGSSSGGSSGFVGGSSGGDDGGGLTGGSSGGGTDGGGSSGGPVTGEGGSGESGASSGGPTIPVPEGGAPSSPGMVPCGSTTCTSSTQYCCVDTAADGGMAQSCDPYNGGTCPNTAIHVQCKEASDCSGGGVCCQALAFGPHSTSCMASCGTANFQVCRTDSECGAGSDAGAAKKCIVQTCPTQMPVGGPGGGFPGGGFPGGTPGGGTPGGGSGGGTPTATVEACAYFTATGAGGGTWGPLPYCTAK